MEKAATIQVHFFLPGLDVEATDFFSASLFMEVLVYGSFPLSIAEPTVRIIFSEGVVSIAGTWEVMVDGLPHSARFSSDYLNPFR